MVRTQESRHCHSRSSILSSASFNWLLEVGHQEGSQLLIHQDLSEMSRNCTSKVGNTLMRYDLLSKAEG